MAVLKDLVIETNKTACKAIRVLIMLIEIFSLLKPTVKMKLFKLTIIPVVTYGNLCWYCDVENLKKERKRENVSRRSVLSG